MHAKVKSEPRPGVEHRPAVSKRRRFTSRELIAMEEAGMLHPDERGELIAGEIITMATKSPRYDAMRTANRGWRLPTLVSHLWLTMQPH